MADLANLADLDRFLGGPATGENSIRQALLDGVEAIFEAQCGRGDHPFAAARAGVVEHGDGSGGSWFSVAYPIATLTSVLLGRDVAAPDETLDPTDVRVLSWTPGSARIARVDGGRFGCLGDPRYVHVTYDAADDLPEDAKIAILRGAATLYRQRGNEDVRTYTDGGYTAELLGALANDPVWAMTVSAHRDPVLR